MLVRIEVAESSKCINMTPFSFLFWPWRERERDPQMEVFWDYLNITLHKYQ